MLTDAFYWFTTNNWLGLSWHLALWTIAGALVGLALGISSFLFIRSRGGYRLGIERARWLRALVCSLNIAVFTLACGYMGLFEGGWRGIREMVKTSSLVSDFNAKFGEVEAMFFAGVYHACAIAQNNPQIKPEDAFQKIRVGVTSFVHGREEIHVLDLQRNMDAIGKEAINQVVGVVQLEVAALIPSLKESTQGAFFKRFLDELGHATLHDPAADGMRRIRLDIYLNQILSGMPAEAARSGNPETISFKEMSDYLAREGLMPWVLNAVRGMVRTHQLFALLAMLIALVLPLSGFMIARISR
jgi:hypothetical protein